MTKYRFHVGDTVRGRYEGREITGTVLSIGSGAGTDWYKILSEGEVYNCRDAELEPEEPEDSGELEEVSVLHWHPATEIPEKGKDYFVIYRGEATGILLIYAVTWTGEKWVFRGKGSIRFTERIIAWAPLKWPKLAGEDGYGGNQAGF